MKTAEAIALLISEGRTFRSLDSDFILETSSDRKRLSFYVRGQQGGWALAHVPLNVEWVEVP